MYMYLIKWDDDPSDLTSLVHLSSERVPPTGGSSRWVLILHLDNDCIGGESRLYLSLDVPRLEYRQRLRH